MSNQVANIHDAFFKQVLSDPKLADTFLREHLPADVVGLLGPEPPEPVPGSFVDEELRQHHSAFASKPVPMRLHTWSTRAHRIRGRACSYCDM
jgi:hypothetical protein